MIERFLVIIVIGQFAIGDCGECKLKRYANNNGFHRDIITEVTLIGVSDSALKCKVMLIEFVPSGLYVDIHEVKTKGQLQIYSASKVDIEAPEYISHSYELYVWHEFIMNTSQSTTVHVNLPVHIRYHRPTPEGPANVILDPPRIFAQCEGTDFVFQRVEGSSAFSPCDPSNMSSLCEWRELLCASQGSSERLEFIVPVGNPDHLFCVLGITLLVSMGGCLVMLYYTYSSPITKRAASRKSKCTAASSNNSNDKSKSSSTYNSSKQHTKSNHTQQTQIQTKGTVQNSSTEKGNRNNSPNCNHVSKSNGELNHSLKNGKELYNLRKRGK